MQLASGGKQGKIASIDTETTAKALRSLARATKERESYEKRAQLWREERLSQFKTVRIDELTPEDFQEDPI